MAALANDEIFKFLAGVPDESAHLVVLQRGDIADAVVCEAFRVLVPGGLVLAFTATSVLATASNTLVSAGFRIRDTLAWIRPNVQSTSFGLGHVVRNSDAYESRRAEILERLSGKRTLRLRNAFVPIVLAQRPYQGTLIGNQLAHDAGMMNETRNAAGLLLPNVLVTAFGDEASYDHAFLVARPPHTSVGEELQRLLYHLFATFTHDGATIVDPAADTGASWAAAMLLGRRFLGNEHRRDAHHKACAHAASVAEALQQAATSSPRIVCFE